MSGLSITPGAPSFLVIALDTFGQIKMRHKSYIGFINSHTESYSGHNNNAVFP